MEPISQTSFWATVTIIATALGGVLAFSASHSGTPKHASAAHVSQVSALEVRVERVATQLEHNAEKIGEVKEDIQSLRLEQKTSAESILRAIEGSR